MGSGVKAAVTRAGRDPIPEHVSDTTPVLRLPSASLVLFDARPSACRGRERPDPLEHRPEELPGQVALGQQQPVVAGVLDQPPTRFDEALLELLLRVSNDPNANSDRPIVSVPAPQAGSME